MIHLSPLGDRAWLARFDTEGEAAAWAAGARRALASEAAEVVLAYRSVAVHAGPGPADMAALRDRIAALPAGPPASGPAACGAEESTLVTVPVLYDGPDLSEAARRLGLEVGELIDQHSSVDYRVFAIGFLPGFPYAGYLPDSLCGVPRRAEPRVRVPAGSVAIAGRQTAIYPADSPGGWAILGRTPCVIAGPERGFFPIRAGDRLRFRPIDGREFDRLEGADLAVDRPAGLADGARAD